MRFKDNLGNMRSWLAGLGHFELRWLHKLVLTLAVAALACNLPLLAATPAVSPPPPIIWMTNTPTIEAVGELDSTPGPEGTPEPEPTFSLPPTITPDPDWVNTTPYLYNTQAGDTLDVLAVRFSARPEEITSPQLIPNDRMIDPGQLIIIPRHLFNTTDPQRILPNSEVVYSPTALDFDIETFVEQAGGYLSSYDEYLGSTGQTTGAGIVARVALENSINPRLLLSLLEYQSGWVFGSPSEREKIDYPMGLVDRNKKGLYHQLVWAINHLSVGYYGWREGLLTDIALANPGGSGYVSARLNPTLNAGSVALQYYFAQVFDSADWLQAIDMETGWPALHESMFGSPWSRNMELFPPHLTQPRLNLPFALGQIWSYSGGPHGAWEKDGSRAALDFAPASVETGCAKSTQLVVAAAPGIVVRSGRGVIVLDLDGDGREQTGWALIYLHISSERRIPIGSWVTQGDFLGYPSCEGGRATGTHIHIARKYNGEWISADGPLPFNLSGWVASAGEQPYEGSLSRENQTIVANPYGTSDTQISRSQNDP